MSDSGSLTAQPVLYLDVISGETLIRRHSVRAGRFVIGSDQACHLCPGGDSPLIHSILNVEGTQAELSRFSDDAHLLVNNREVDVVRLADGDRITIGTTCLSVVFAGLPAAAASVPLTATDHAAIDSLESSPEDGCASLSTEELVDLLECDLDLINTFDAGVHMGLRSLEQAVLNHTAGVEAGEPKEQPEVVAQPDPYVNQQSVANSGTWIDEIVARLQRVSVDLTLRAERIRQRELQCIKAADELLKEQQRLRSQVEFLAGRLSALTSRPAEEFRKSA